MVQPHYNTLENTIYSVVFYYLLIISNFTDTLLSPDLRNLIENNRSIKHLFGLILLIMSVNQHNKKDNSILYNIGISILCYIYFIFSTKMILSLNLILIFIMILFYYIEKYIKNNIHNTDNFLVKNHKKIRISFIILITGILIFGNIHFFSIYYKTHETHTISSILFEYVVGKNWFNYKYLYNII